MHERELVSGTANGIGHAIEAEIDAIRQNGRQSRQLAVGRRGVPTSAI
jgi:hypothetical protein